jgi:hypothetical protein
MDQSTFNDYLMKLFTTSSIPFVVGVIIFCLWLYFSIGMITRLTDIRYKLEDIHDAMKTKDVSTNKKVVVAVKEATQFEDGFRNLRKPSRTFIMVLVAAIVVFVVLLIIASILGQ